MKTFESFSRINKPPSKELIRLFIRNSALRLSQTSAYMVELPLVEKYQLQSKIEDMDLTPTKVRQIKCKKC